MYILYGIRMYKYGLHIYIDITMTYQENQEYTVYSHVFTNFLKMIICCVALRCWERTPASRSTETNQRPLPQRLLVVDLMVSYSRQKRFFGWRMDLIQCLRCWFFFFQISLDSTIQPLQICFLLTIGWSIITWPYTKNNRVFFLQTFARLLKSWPTWCLDCRTEPPSACMWDERPWDRLR